MNSEYSKLTGWMAFALVALSACTSGPSSTDHQGAQESDLGHEVDHEHGELYEPHSPAPDADAAAVADAWLVAFTAGGNDTDEWFSTLEPYCFVSYCELIAQTDPEQIPTEAPTGPATVASTDRADAVVATAPATGGTWTVSLLATADGHWEVYSCNWEAT